MQRQTSNHLLLALILMGLFAIIFCLSSESFIFKNSFAQPVATTVAVSTVSSDSPLGGPANVYATTGTFAGYLDNGSSSNSSSSGGNNQIKSNNMVQFNHYENNEIGISLKYPSNFLIDESNSNNTLRQISFYPSNSQTISSNPDQYILWMDVFVSTPSQQHPLLSLSNRFSSTPSLGSSPDLSSYSLNLAHSIQQANKDVSVIGSSSNVTLSGHPAYKLITKSYIGNTAIVDVLISTLVNNTIYSLDFQSNLLDYLNSISDTNKIIQSFEIFPPTSLASSNTLPPSQSSSFLSQPPVSSSPLPSSSQLPSLQQPETSNTKPSNSLLIPLLSGLLSNSQLNNLANNSTNALKSLKNSLTNSINDVLSNPQNAINNTIKGTTSLIPTTPSELSSLPSTALKKACGLPFVSDVCTQIGNSVSNKAQNPSGESGTSTSNSRSNNTGSNSISNNTAINRDNRIIDNGTIGANINREMNIGNGKSNTNNDNVIGNVKLNSNNNGSAITNNNSSTGGGGSSSNSTGNFGNNNKRNSLMASLENLFSAKTSNSSNQSLSSNSSILGSGLSFLKKLLFLHSTPSSQFSSIVTSHYPFSSHSSSNPPLSQMNTPSHQNSSSLATTTTINRINQSNSTVISPSLSSNSSSLTPSSSSLSAPPPSSYIPPPIH